MKKIDLQIHTNFSDGVFSPKEIVDLAIKNKMKAIAITDHDTISGLKEAIEYSKDKNLEFVPGVEFSCHEEFYTQTIDVLGLFINHKNEELNEFIKKCQGDRIKEKKEIIKKLNNLGYEITFDELLKESGDSLGRPVIGKILVSKYPNEFSNVDDVFKKLIGEGKPAFVPRQKTSIKQAINIIKRSGGISILAHPGRYGNFVFEIIGKFEKDGGNGMEVDYPYNKILGTGNEINDKLRVVAKEKNLLISGGSDFHDFERGSLIGDAGLTETEFDKLKDYKHHIKLLIL
ncbi:PHP domain-containing protein [Candidatus Pacearchaeota archaeon]|nr:PHP domain-containing protein [Candidatus Pacearchaeota archaeon]